RSVAPSPCTCSRTFSACSACGSQRPTATTSSTTSTSTTCCATSIGRPRSTQRSCRRVRCSVPFDFPLDSFRRGQASRVGSKSLALHHGLDPGAPGEGYQVVVHVDAAVPADPDQAGQSVLEDGLRDRKGV